MKEGVAEGRVLELRNLAVGYSGKVLLKKVNLEVFQGDFIAIVGANGSGKSTLVKTILGLVPAVSGEVKFSEMAKREAKCEAGRRVAVGYLPQEMRVDGNFPATVMEIVLSGTLRGLRPFYGREERKVAEKALELLGILKLSRKSFADLSGGQKQKVLLARALVASGEFNEVDKIGGGLLILDEPSNNLDYASREEFYRILKRLNKERGLTILMITHDLDFRDLVGNKIWAVEGEKVAEYETVEYIEKFHPTHEVVDTERGAAK